MGISENLVRFASQLCWMLDIPKGDNERTMSMVAAEATCQAAWNGLSSWIVQWIYVSLAGRSLIEFLCMRLVGLWEHEKSVFWQVRLHYYDTTLV